MLHSDSLSDHQLGLAAAVVDEYNEQGCVCTDTRINAANAGWNVDYLISVAPDLKEILDEQLPFETDDSE